MNSYRHLNVRNSTFKMIIDECIEEFRKHHPELEHMEITQDKIIYEIGKFYLTH